MCSALLLPAAEGSAAITNATVIVVHRAAGEVWGKKYAFTIFSSLFHLVCSLETGKNRRLKQAKEEAQAEIEQYRLQREKEFKAKEAAVCFLDHSLLPAQPLSLAFGVTCLESSPWCGTCCWRSTSLTAFL